MDRNALMGPFQQGYAGNVVERGNIIPAGTYEDGVTRWAWPGIIDGPWEAWKRFALSGGEDVKAGAEVATNALMGGVVSPKPTNALGTFGGRLAKTADHAALARAEEMTARGVPREQVWNATGWFRGVDGKWRFEIDDSGSSLLTGDGSGRLGDHLMHNDLFAAYPDARDIGITRTYQEGGGRGAYRPGLPADGDSPAIRENIRLNRAYDQNSTVLHELQHGIQGREAFADGGSLGSVTSTPEYIAAMARYEAQGDGDGWTSINAATPSSIADGIYRRLAGEVEARTVQKRMDMTAEERRARPPWLDYDVPENQQIVRWP